MHSLIACWRHLKVDVILYIFYVFPEISSVLLYVFMFNLLRAGKYLNLGAMEIISTLFRPALASGLMFVAVTITRQVLPWSHLFNLMILVMAGMFTYSLFTFTFNSEGLQDARNMIRRRSID